MGVRALGPAHVAIVAVVRIAVTVHPEGEESCVCLATAYQPDTCGGVTHQEKRGKLKQGGEE